MYESLTKLGERRIWPVRGRKGRYRANAGVFGEAARALVPLGSRRGWALALVIGVAIACSGLLAPPVASAVTPVGEAASRPLVTYRQEGGIGGPRPSLIVSKDRRARVTLGGCSERFALRRGQWNVLREALEHAHLHAIAGDYPAPEGYADTITYVIRAGGERVRIALPQPGNEEVMRDLRPLLKALNKTVSAGERRMPSSCGGSR
jgi:hypothetical protein